MLELTVICIFFCRIQKLGKNFVLVLKTKEMSERLGWEDEDKPVYVIIEGKIKS